MNLTVVILTRNEETHVGRALKSVKGFATTCVVVDSGSTDRTVPVALSAGAIVLEHHWVNYASQFNWALSNLPAACDWVLRLDADEIVTDELAEEIRTRLPTLDAAICGVVVSRRMTFMRKPMRWGGLFPIRVLRLIRTGRGRCENRWMDEHLIADGPVADFQGEILDDNTNSLGWWTEKHNGYSAREVVDILNREYGFLDSDSPETLNVHARKKRWAKQIVYSRLPPAIRSSFYFLYRYFFRLGFLDGYEGLLFHVFQGFWYRFLVDAKLHEVRRHMECTGEDAGTAIKHVLGIDVTNKSSPSSATEIR